MVSKGRSGMVGHSLCNQFQSALGLNPVIIHGSVIRQLRIIRFEEFLILFSDSFLPEDFVFDESNFCVRFDVRNYDRRFSVSLNRDAEGRFGIGHPS